MVVVCAGVGLLVYALRFILLPFVFGAAFAFALQPLVIWLKQCWHWPHWMAATLAFLVLLAVIGAGAYGLGAGLSADVSRLSQDLPNLLRPAIEAVIGKNDQHVFGQTVNAENLSHRASDAIEESLHDHGNLVGVVVKSLAGAMGLFLTLLLALYFLLSGQTLLKGLLGLVPPAHRRFAGRIGEHALDILRHYFVGVAIIIAMTAAVAWIALGLVLHLPHALLLSIVVGVFELVPVAGPILSITVVSLVALGEGSAWMILGVAIFFLLLRLGIDQVVGPLVLGKVVRLHPVTVLFVMLAGMTLFGVLGVVLAVPLAATIKMSLREHYQWLENDRPVRCDFPRHDVKERR
jgi:predicted PurR-regulated permease PerM